MYPKSSSGYIKSRDMVKVEFVVGEPLANKPGSTTMFDNSVLLLRELNIELLANLIIPAL
jgi:hypothetical protein